MSSSSRKAVSTSLIIIAVIAMYNWMVAPRAKYLSAAQQYGSAMEKVIKKNKIIETKVRIKKKELQKLKEQSVQLQNLLFTPDEAREFFSDLQAISEESGCLVYSVNLITDKQSPQHGQLEGTAGIVTRSAILSVVAVYRNITQLIQRLQSRTQKVWIDSINLRALNDSSDQPRCDITITICTLTEKEQAL